MLCNTVKCYGDFQRGEIPLSATTQMNLYFAIVENKPVRNREVPLKYQISKDVAVLETESKRAFHNG